MALKTFRPLTASLRFTTLNRPDDITDKRPERSLVESKPKTGGRNTYGRITSRRRGGGHKKLYRIIDFKRRRSNTIPTAPRSSRSSPMPTARRPTFSRPRASRSATPSTTR